MTMFQWESDDERERARVGDQAEMYVRQVLRTYADATFLRGPLVPNMDTHTHGGVSGFREADFLVYTQGTVFCIEVKHYAGTISYAPRTPSGQGWHGNQSHQYNTSADYDTSKIVQIKQGRHGRLVEKTYPNPLQKTRSFVRLLKQYVGRIEPRFERLFLVPVVCFSSQADISRIYSFQDGIIHIEHLPAFFQQQRNERFAANPTAWITETILKKIPNWDRVCTSNGTWVNGILVEPHLTFTGHDGRPYALPNYATVKTISWQHAYGTACAQMTVIYTNGHDCE
jgi:hypothetical protein